jgi:hypothetical protein
VTIGRFAGSVAVIVGTDTPDGVAVHGSEVNSVESDLSNVCGGGVGVEGLNVRSCRSGRREE